MQTQPRPEYDFTSPRAAVESVIKAAEKGDAEAFKRGVSSDMLEKLTADGYDLSERMREISRWVFSGEISQDGDAATVRLTHEESVGVEILPLVREDKEWKITLPITRQ